MYIDIHHKPMCYACGQKHNSFEYCPGFRCFRCGGYHNDGCPMNLPRYCNLCGRSHGRRFGGCFSHFDSNPASFRMVTEHTRLGSFSVFKRERQDEMFMG